MNWNMWLLTVIAITSSIAAFAQSFNAIHQLWINLRNIRRFCSQRLGRTHHLSENTFHPETGFGEFEDLFINIPTPMNATKRLVTHGKPESFPLSEWLHSSEKMSAVVMWEDPLRRYLNNPNAAIYARHDFMRDSHITTWHRSLFFSPA